jgi:integrase
VKLYKKEKALDNTARTISAKQGAFDDFSASAGSRPTDEYSLDDAVAYKNRLIEQGGSASRINSKLSYLRDLFAYALANGQHPGPNPFENAKVSSKSKLEQKKRSYKPFTSDDIKPSSLPRRIRSAWTNRDIIGCRFSRCILARGSKSWRALPCRKCNGMEKCGFSSSSKQKTPILCDAFLCIKKIVESGFLAYVEKVKASGATQVFPELKPGQNGYGKNVTRRFADYLDECEIRDDRKVFHSFRHTFIGRMSARNVHPAMLMALVGHYDQAKVDFNSPHFTNYQHDKTLAELKQTIDLLDIGIAADLLNKNHADLCASEFIRHASRMPPREEKRSDSQIFIDAREPPSAIFLTARGIPKRHVVAAQ